MTKTIKKTFKELGEVNELVGELYKNDPKLKDTKFGYAFKRFMEKNYEPTNKEMQEKLIDVRIDNALEDKLTKEIMMDKTNSRQMKYSKDGLKKCIAAERKIYDEFDGIEIEIIPFITTQIPTVLIDEQKEVLKGLII